MPEYFHLKLVGVNENCVFFDPAQVATDPYHVQDGGFQLGSPEKVQTWSEVSILGGSKLQSNRRGNRKATISFEIRGATRSSISDSVDRISRLIDQAQQYALGKSADRVTLEYSWDKDTRMAYFEVLDGALTLPDDVLSLEQLVSTILVGSSGYYALTNCKLDLTLSPDNYGVSPVNGNLIELPISNRNTSGVPTTGGILCAYTTDSKVVYGHNHDSYIDIPGNSILGDSPALVKIVIDGRAYGTSSGGNPNGCDISRVAMGLTTSPNKGSTVYQWDTVTAVGGIPAYLTFDPDVLKAVEANSYAPLGYDLNVTVPAISSPKTIIFLNIDNPSLYQGDHYRLIMHHNNGLFTNDISPDRLFRAVVYDSVGDAPLYMTDWVMRHRRWDYDVNFIDFGPIPIPPLSKKLTDVSPIKIGIEAGPNQYNSSDIFSLDYFLLMPIEKGYRVVTSRLPVLVMHDNYKQVIDDGWNAVSYAISNAGKQAAIISNQFAPIKLQPGVDQRLYLYLEFIPELWGQEGLQEGDYFYKVKLYYAPTYTGVA